MLEINMSEYLKARAVFSKSFDLNSNALHRTFLLSSLLKDINLKKISRSKRDNESFQKIELLIFNHDFNHKQIKRMNVNKLNNVQLIEMINKISISKKCFESMKRLKI